MDIFHILLHLFIAIPISSSVPFKRENGFKDVLKNERRFPNGSVIATYACKDENGNPVYIRYYANDSSYGVELKSVRIVEHDSDQTNPQDKFLLNIDNKVDSSDVFGSANSTSDTVIADNFYKNNSYNPYEIINSNPYKKTKGHHKPDDEYEIFLENILKPSNKYNKEKVRVYVDKNRRKVRKIHNSCDKSLRKSDQNESLILFEVG